MKVDNTQLSIPIHLKLHKNQPWPTDRVFYYVTEDGTFLCRNNRFFRSSVRADDVIQGLAEHEEELILDIPKLSQGQIEQVVGFFSLIAKKQNSEAAVLLVWDTVKKTLEVVCPPQNADVGPPYTDWRGERKMGGAMSVKYNIESVATQLGPTKMIIGDIHSHVNMPAFSSGMDQKDEETKPGVHIVVGRISEEPPEFHIEYTVDAVRFSIINPLLAWEGYRQRREKEVPPEWMDAVNTKIREYKPCELGRHDDWDDRHKGYEVGDQWVHGHWVGDKWVEGTWVKGSKSNHKKNKKRGFFKNLF